MSSTVTLGKTTTMLRSDGDVVDDAACCCLGSPTLAAGTMKSPLLERGKGGEVRGDDVDNGTKRRRCRHELVAYDALPEFLKHNEFIVNYYRSEWPIKQALLSAFAVHNETINVWTHLIGFFMFLALTVCAATMVPMETSVSHSATSTGLANRTTGNPMVMMTYSTAAVVMQALRSVSVEPAELGAAAAAAAALSAAGHRVARWPFYAYLCGAMFCLLMSSTCHLLSCHSDHANYLLLRLDYAGITGLIVTSFYPLVYYTFVCDPFFRTLYLGFITVFGAAAVTVSLLPVFERPELRWARAALFACMGASGLVPIVHKMLVFGTRPEAVLTTLYETAMGVFYLAGVVVYATRVPERWLPGKFDLVGHSHQLFHALVVAGAYTHYLAGLVYLSWRDSEMC